ncbi:MAG: ABC transporter permease, partial [Chloroflexota bacterium]
VVGALIIGVLETGLTILAVPSLWKFIVVGLIIIVAVLVNNVQERLEARRVKREEHAHEG